MKKTHLSLLLLVFFASSLLRAQLPYTQPQYAVWEEKDIPYGTAVHVAGGQTDLLLDLYKPVGDGNCRRPLVVLIHGGAWIAGTKADADVVAMCREMARRGYVAASIKYRLGMHPSNFYVPYALCNDAINPVGVNKCIYVADSLEIARALYRGMQDAKGAVRFLKNRHAQDSTDVGNVFVGGSSAGAFIALCVGFLDQPQERPAATWAQADAPLPDSDLLSCLPPNADRKRPDLGDIEGNLHLGGHDARVRGVAAFMGGIFDTAILPGNAGPATYLYHRADDLVVPCTHDQLFPMFPFCIIPLNLCQPLGVRPWVHGSCAVADALENQGGVPVFRDLLPKDGPPGSKDCFDDPSGHSIENIPLRCANVAQFFAPVIAASGNVPTPVCAVETSELVQESVRVWVAPNPVVAGQPAYLHCAGCSERATQVEVWDIWGRLIARYTLDTFPAALDLKALGSAGRYWIRVQQGENMSVAQIFWTGS